MTTLPLASIELILPTEIPIGKFQGAMTKPTPFGLNLVFGFALLNSFKEYG